MDEDGIFEKFSKCACSLRTFSLAAYSTIVSFVVCVCFLLGTPDAVGIGNASARGEDMKITINGPAGAFVGIKSKSNGHALIFAKYREVG